MAVLLKLMGIISICDNYCSAADYYNIYCKLHATDYSTGFINVPAIIGNFQNSNFPTNQPIMTTLMQLHFIVLCQKLNLLCSVYCSASHCFTALASLASQLALRRMASQFCLTVLSAIGQGFSLKNCSISTAFSSDTNPAVVICTQQNNIQAHHHHFVYVSTLKK